MIPSKSLGTALVTGASAGIGATYARRLAARGHALLLVARDRARLRALADELVRDAGIEAEILVADLGATADLARVEQRLREDARITTLVNNAGITGDGPLATADPGRLEALIRLNIVAPTRLVLACLPRMLAQGHGAIINIASVTALLPESFEACYSASKAYVLNFSQSLHSEAGAKGIRVQAVLPGITRTAIWAGSGHDIDAFPPEMVMDVDTLVDAALSGFDQGEVVTIPSLPDAAEWDAFTTQRRQLMPRLSRREAAPRYRPGPG